ncbi:trichohyalin-like [Montipora foliosa]|uniref:trichohyalin-like n=1 Tax=Montipora foliosa TaxID=591990 RepID=UPI0035F19207
MDKKHRNILRHHRPYLLENLQPIKLLPYLSSILDESDRQEVRQEPTTEQQIDTLLDMLSRKGPDAFGQFINALERKQMFIALHLKQETEMEKIKTELICARADSARMREKALITRQELEKERETHKRTLKELEALKKLEKEINAAENMEPRLQELEGTITRLEQEVRNEKRDKEIFEQETKRLRDVCDHLDEKNKQSLSDLRALQDENQELAKQLLNVNDNKDIRKDLARVTEEREELKEQCENLEKQLQESKAYMERQLAANQFHDRATSPVEAMGSEIKEIREIKKELSRARTDLDSVRLREKVVIARQELEKEQKTCRNTSKELEAMSSLHKKPVKERNDADNTKARLQELEAIITCLEQEVRNEKRDKEIFEEETTRLRDVCDHLDETNKQTLSDLQALQEENQELAKQLFDVNNNKDTCKDLARVTEERKELKHSKEQCQNVEKQLEEAKANMEKHLAANHFQDKATSPVEPKECDIKDESCSRCKKLEGKLNLITSERDSMREQNQNLDEEVLNLNNRIKEMSEDNQREKLTLHKEPQFLKEERENLSRELEEANAQQQDETKILQAGKNGEQKNPMKRQTSDVHKITVQLMSEKTPFEKSQEEWEQTKKNLARKKEGESKAKLETKKQINKSKYELKKQDTHLSEGISRLGETTNAERPRSKSLIKEGQRLRNVPRWGPNYKRTSHKHGVPDLCLRNNFRSPDSSKP